MWSIKIFKCFYPPRILNEHWCLCSCLQMSPGENWFQYVRRVYASEINFPCIITLARLTFEIKKINKYFYFLILPFYRMEWHSSETVGRTWCTAVYILELYNLQYIPIYLYTYRVYLILHTIEHTIVIRKNLQLNKTLI